MNFKKLAILAGFVAATSTAYAAVIYDAAGVGFVGKGDVQLAFGWNNSSLQKNAPGVTFTYDIKDTYDVTCEWDTETGGPKSKTIHHDITIPRSIKLNATIAYDPRVKNQITGFNLNGFSNQMTVGTVPVLGEACPGNNPGTVTLVEATGSSGGLYVSYKDARVLLPLTPVVTTTTTTTTTTAP